METKVKKAPAPKQEVKKDTWEYKDRHYYLTGDKEPLTYTLISRHSKRYPCVWFDKDKGYERELRYATNQKSIFVDEQKGNVTLAHVVFEKGHLFVPKEKRNLQEFLAHHPHFNLLFTEHDAVVEAADDYDLLKLEMEAMNAAVGIDVDQAEAIMRVEKGSAVNSMSSKELKRDILLFAKQNPKTFIALANDDNVQLRNTAIRAEEAGIIRLSGDQRTFTWGSNGRKLMNVPFDENPYSAFAAFLKTDEGVEIYKSIDKKL